MVSWYTPLPLKILTSRYIFFIYVSMFLISTIYLNLDKELLFLSSIIKNKVHFKQREMNFLQLKFYSWSVVKDKRSLFPEFPEHYKLILNHKSILCQDYITNTDIKISNVIILLLKTFTVSWWNGDRNVVEIQVLKMNILS